MQKKPRKIGILTSSAASIIAISAGLSSASPLPRIENLDSLGNSSGNTGRSANLTAEVNQATRNESGNLLSVVWSIENNSEDRVVVTWIADRSYTYSGPYFSGVTVLSSDGGTRYHPVMDGSGECLCSGNTSSNFKERIEPEEKVAYWSLFSVPKNVETLTIEIPEFDPIEDIPIS
jgi:hypothetical protein